MQEYESFLKERIRKLVVLFGGPELSDDEIYIIRNPKGGSEITIDETGRIRLFAILKRYAEGPETLLAAKVAHELMNIRRPVTLSHLDRIEMRIVERLKKCKSICPGASLVTGFLVQVIRTIFEAFLGGIFRMRNRKIPVDRDTIDLLERHHFPIYSFFLVLQDAYEQATDYPWPRSSLRRWLMQQRIASAKTYTTSKFLH